MQDLLESHSAIMELIGNAQALLPNHFSDS